MSPNRTDEHDLDRAACELRVAPAVATKLLAHVIDLACPRISILTKAGKTARLRQLIGTGAPVDAVLALLELELPQWRLRRLVLDDGRWHCSLSRQRDLPIELANTAEGTDEDVAAAILTALIEALRMAGADGEAAICTGPAIPAAEHLICCDNFC